MQVWMEMALCCGYIQESTFRDFDDRYDHILGQLIRMTQTADKWASVK